MCFHFVGNPLEQVETVHWCPSKQDIRLNEKQFAIPDQEPIAHIRLLSCQWWGCCIAVVLPGATFTETPKDFLTLMIQWSLLLYIMGSWLRISYDLHDDWQSSWPSFMPPGPKQTPSWQLSNRDMMTWRCAWSHLWTLLCQTHDHQVAINYIIHF